MNTHERFNEKGSHTLILRNPDTVSVNIKKCYEKNLDNFFQRKDVFPQIPLNHFGRP